MKLRPGFASAAVILALVGMQALFVASYVGHEHTIYFWDHAMYFDMVRRFYFTLTQNPSAGWALFKNALSGNYNLIFALPSCASFALLGPTRLVFILTNFFVFFLAYEIAIAFFLRHMLSFNWASALILSLVACALVPPLWLPLLEGYPDAGAAACIIFAAALALKGPGESRIIPRALALGLILGLAVLLRRHFVYPAFALLGALGGMAFWDAARAREERWEKMGRAALYFTTCGFAFSGLLFLVAPDFLHDALTTNYRVLYLSYQRPPLVFLYFVLGGFGFGLLLIALSGLLLLARSSEAGGKAAALTALYTFLWLAVWCLGPDQMGHHYILHALPFFTVLGIVGWFVFLAPRVGTKKYIWGGSLALFLAANSAWALWLSPDGVWPNDNGRPELFSAPRPPVVRVDYDEWLRLADYLRRTTKPDDHLMIVGSSFVFNQDILHSIYADILGVPDMTTRFPKAPEIDHEEPAPLDVFAASDVYVVAAPAQYHLDPAGQHVVTAAANRFPPPPAYAALFRADDVTFHLADNVTVKIWRRRDWTPAALRAAMEDIRRDAPRDPSFDQDWIATALPLIAQIRTDNGNRTNVAGLFTSDHRGLKLFFDYPLAAGTYQLGLSAASNCPDLQFHLDILAADGRVETAKSFAPILLPGQVFQSFASPTGDHFLRLDLATETASLCRVDLGGLQVKKAP
jgi:hypothetical protein